VNMSVSADLDPAKVRSRAEYLHVTGFSLLYFGPSRMIISPTILNKAAVRKEGAIIVVVILTPIVMTTSYHMSRYGYPNSLHQERVQQPWLMRGPKTTCPASYRSSDTVSCFNLRCSPCNFAHAAEHGTRDEPPKPVADRLREVNNASGAIQHNEEDTDPHRRRVPIRRVVILRRAIGVGVSRVGHWL
jgi:hypothetical protein